MIDVTKEQKREHRVIEEALNVLNHVCVRFEKSEEVDPEIIAKTLEFLRIFADKCHHGKEQDLLFPALEMNGVSRKDSIIGRLRREHEIAEKFLWNVERALQDYKGGDTTARKDILQNARAYQELLRQHIDKEDNTLYPLAEKELSEEVKRGLLSAYERFENEVIGEGVHERYHHLIENMKRKVGVK